MSQKLLIDVEEKNKARGYGFISENGERIEAISAGKIVIPVPENERDLKIYKLFAENCDLVFCTVQTPDEFQFYPVPELSIFAVDHKGNCFGTIGGTGAVAGDDYPVGYVNRDGTYGEISDNLKEFLQLVTYYPYWREIIRYEQTEAPYDISAMEMKQTENNSQYFKHQREIAETLKLSKNPKSIELLLTNIKSTPGFVIYGSKAEAQMTNVFWEIRSFDC
jgi:hypothetical protein